MAYLKPKQTVFFAQGNITSVIEKVAFRKYLTKPKLDKKTGERKRKWKSKRSSGHKLLDCWLSTS